MCRLRCVSNFPPFPPSILTLINLALFHASRKTPSFSTPSSVRTASSALGLASRVLLSLVTSSASPFLVRLLRPYPRTSTDALHRPQARTLRFKRRSTFVRRSFCPGSHLSFLCPLLSSPYSQLTLSSLPTHHSKTLSKSVKLEVVL